jgi:hypothetical protein
MFNIQGNGIKIDYSGGAEGNGKITLVMPDTLKAPGPFYVEAEAQDGDDDRLVIGGCVDAYESFSGDRTPGRSSTSPGLLMVGGKVKLFNELEYIQLSDSVFGSLSDGETKTKLLVIWVNSAETPAADYSDRNVFYNYAFIAKDDISGYPDWEKDGKKYFPLGWITVKKNVDDPSDKYKKVEAISWPNTEWLREGGATSNLSYWTLVKVTGVGWAGTVKYYTINEYKEGSFSDTTSTGHLFLLNTEDAEHSIATNTWLYAMNKLLLPTMVSVPSTVPGFP